MKRASSLTTPGANAGRKELVLCALLLSSRDIVGGIEWVRNAVRATRCAVVEKGKSSIGPRFTGRSWVIGLGAIGSKIAHDA